MARPFLLLTILDDAGSLHAIPPGADAEISGHAPLVAELVGHANQTTTNDMADGAWSRRRVPEGVFPSAAGTRARCQVRCWSRILVFVGHGLSFARPGMEGASSSYQLA